MGKTIKVSMELRDDNGSVKSASFTSPVEDAPEIIEGENDLMNGLEYAIAIEVGNCLEAIHVNSVMAIAAIAAMNLPCGEDRPCRKLERAATALYNEMRYDELSRTKAMCEIFSRPSVELK